MTNLTTLDLVNNQITDLSPLVNLTNLTSLRLNFNQITDISPLASLTNLQELNVGSNQIADISSVAGLVNLTDFRAHDNRITDITALSELTKLTGLNLSNNLITDITTISELTNLTELNLERNQIADITPLAGLTNLYHILLDNNPFIDWSPLNNLFPSVASPTVTPVPVNPHLFADVLSDFFVNLATPPNLHRGRPTSYHAVLVDINGTPGMLASKWTSDNVNYSHWFPNEIGPVFVQRVFYIYDNRLYEVSDNIWWAVTQTGQLVIVNGVDNILGYILLSVVDGNLVSTKSISSISYQGMWGYLSGDENREDEYFVNHHNGILPWFGEDWRDYNQPLTLEEFNEMKAKYDLHNLITNLWELPDETLTILSMSAE
ncbi:MAG: leucine-rich repeat domain-containing protein [Defluviitaleaceae bacterium]|nr:leucine-rich repeat domain-containing protein [Defluviitaleaceae bacterium]